MAYGTERPDEPPIDLPVAPISDQFNFPPASSPPVKQLKGIITQLISTENLLRELGRNLGGWKWNEREKKWYQDPNSILMNNNGISVVLSMLGPLISPNTVLTIVRADEIKRKVYLDISRPMHITLGSNIRTFGIKPSYLPMIMSMIESTYEHALRRGLDGKTLKYVFSNISESLVKREENEKPKREIPFVGLKI